MIEFFIDYSHNLLRTAAVWLLVILGASVIITGTYGHIKDFFKKATNPFRFMK